MPPHPLFIPEILNLIFESLDTTSLITAATVCRVWNASVLPVLWRNVVHLDRDSTFYDRVRTHGHYIHGLDISLAKEQHVWGSCARQLTLVLQETPRLKSLTLRLPEDCQPAARQEVYQIIRDYVAGNLTTLCLAPTPCKQTPHQLLSRMSVEDATVLFPALTQLTTLEMGSSPPDEALAVIVDSLPGLTAVFLKEQLSTNAGDEEYLGDRGLGLLGQKLFQLQKLSINSNQHITSDGLLVFLNHCQILTHLDLSSCHLLDSIGLERLVESSFLLTHVVLADTLVGDGALLTLAQTTKAARLRSLWIGQCTEVTTLGVQGIVKACVNLEEFDFSGCDRVSMAVFDGPQWECLRIKVLKVGGISQQGAGALSILKQDRVHMYQQLGRLDRLVSLDMAAMPVDLRLFDFGRLAIQNMTRLKRLVMTNRRDNIADKEAIWLATQLPSLRTLLVDADSIRAQLVQDLRDINCNLSIQLQTAQTLDRAHWPQDDSSDMDEDDDNDGSYHGDATFGGHSFYGTWGVDSDDLDDSDGQIVDSDTSVSDDNISNSESSAEDEENSEDGINESDSDNEGEDGEPATMAFCSGYYNLSGSGSLPSVSVSEDEGDEDIPRTLAYYSNYRDPAGYSSTESGMEEVSDDDTDDDTTVSANPFESGLSESEEDESESETQSESDSLDSSSQESDTEIDQSSLEEEADPEPDNEDSMESDIDEHNKDDSVQSDPEDHPAIIDVEGDDDGLDQGYDNESDYTYGDVVEDSFAEYFDEEYEDYGGYEFDDDDACYASF